MTSNGCASERERYRKSGSVWRKGVREVSDIRVSGPLADEDAVVSITRLWGGMAQFLEAGTRVHRSHRFVRERPQDFARVDRGLSRQPGLLKAKETILRQKPGAEPWRTEVAIWASQWAEPSEEIVKLFPNFFEPLEQT